MPLPHLKVPDAVSSVGENTITFCFVDDYAHHPSEIRATLAAAVQQKSYRESTSKDFSKNTNFGMVRQGFQNLLWRYLKLFFLPRRKLNSSNSPKEFGQHGQPVKRVVAIFQPHRYSRTHTFLSEFAQSFSDAGHRDRHRYLQRWRTRLMAD